MQKNLRNKKRLEKLMSTGVSGFLINEHSYKYYTADDIKVLEKLVYLYGIRNVSVDFNNGEVVFYGVKGVEVYSRANNMTEHFEIVTQALHYKNMKFIFDYDSEVRFDYYRRCDADDYYAILDRKYGRLYVDEYYEYLTDDVHNIKDTKVIMTTAYGLNRIYELSQLVKKDGVVIGDLQDRIYRIIVKENSNKVIPINGKVYEIILIEYTEEDAELRRVVVADIVVNDNVCLMERNDGYLAHYVKEYFPNVKIEYAGCLDILEEVFDKEESDLI